ncbi:cation channel family protein [Cystoisospora suis]|uniref:Cation channel family protein n=1 Tax=Cystoisospora suis TaxID=483139 RepID=A0A2C6KNT2_9APIC|nr:cation channel family protein [Cystoisospora suis]
MAFPTSETENPTKSSCPTGNEGPEEKFPTPSNQHLRAPLSHYESNSSPPVVSSLSPSLRLSSSSLPGSTSPPRSPCSAEAASCVPPQGGDEALAAACWVYSVSLLPEQPPLPPSCFSSSRQQNAFRWYLWLRPFVNVALCLYLLLAFFEDPGPVYRKKPLLPSSAYPPPSPSRAARDRDYSAIHEGPGLPSKVDTDGVHFTVPSLHSGALGARPPRYFPRRAFGDSKRGIPLPATSPFRVTVSDPHRFASTFSSVSSRPAPEETVSPHSTPRKLASSSSSTLRTSSEHSIAKTGLSMSVSQEGLLFRENTSHSKTEQPLPRAQPPLSFLPWAHTGSAIRPEGHGNKHYQTRSDFTQQHTTVVASPKKRPSWRGKRICAPSLGPLVTQSVGGSRPADYHIFLPYGCQKGTGGKGGNETSKEARPHKCSELSSLSFPSHSEAGESWSLMHSRHDGERGLGAQVLLESDLRPGLLQVQGVLRKQEWKDEGGGGGAEKRDDNRPGGQALQKSRNKKARTGAFMGVLLESTGAGETMLLSREATDFHTQPSLRPGSMTPSSSSRSSVPDSTFPGERSFSGRHGSPSLLAGSGCSFSSCPPLLPSLRDFLESHQENLSQSESGLDDNGHRPIPSKFHFSPYPPALRTSAAPSLVPELSPRWRRVIHFLIAFVCLSLFLTAAFLQCVYRGTAVRQPSEGGPKGSDEIPAIWSKRQSSFPLPLPLSLISILTCCVVSLLDIVIAALLWPEVEDRGWWGRNGEGERGGTLAHSQFFFYKPYVASRLARPLLLGLFCYPVLRMLVRIVRTLPKVKTIILATFLSVLLFDWLGVILFAGTNGHDEFHSFQSGCTSLLLVVTTVRLPQVLLRGYTVHEVAVLFIVVFYLLTAVLLGLFAAAFYTGYRDGDLQDRREQQMLSRRYVDTAFELLALYQKRLDACLHSYSPDGGLHSDTNCSHISRTASSLHLRDREQAGSDASLAEAHSCGEACVVSLFDSGSEQRFCQGHKLPREPLPSHALERHAHSRAFSMDFFRCSGEHEPNVSLTTWYAFYRHLSQLPGRPRFELPDLAGDLPSVVAVVRGGSAKQEPPARELPAEGKRARDERRPPDDQSTVEDGVNRQRLRGCASTGYSRMQLRQAEFSPTQGSDDPPADAALRFENQSALVLEGVGRGRDPGITEGTSATIDSTQEGGGMLTPPLRAEDKGVDNQHACSSRWMTKGLNSPRASSRASRNDSTVPEACLSVCSSNPPPTSHLSSLSDSQPSKSPRADSLSSPFLNESTSIARTGVAVVEDDAGSNSDSGRSDVPWWQAFWGQRYRRTHLRGLGAPGFKGPREDLLFREDTSVRATFFSEADHFSTYGESAGRVGGQLPMSSNLMTKSFRPTNANVLPAVYPSQSGTGGFFKMRPWENSSRRLWSCVNDDALELFNVLTRGDKGGKGITKMQFQEIVSTLAAYDSRKQKEEERAWRSDSCHSAIHRRLLNAVADVCVVASLVLTYMQTRKFINKASNLTGEDIESSPIDLAEGMPASCFGSVAGAYWLQNALSLVYLASVVIRIRLTTSMKRYTGLSLRERFDICIGVGVMVLELACLWAGSASAFHPACTTETFDDLSRCLAFIRVLRGIRIFFRISPLRKLIVSLVAAVAALNTVLLVLVVIFCAYGTVGMELFGGIIKCDMDHLPPKGPDMDDPTDWGVLNFNDFFASLVTLFLLTVNGWDDSLKALVKHTSVFSCGAYFVSFYILTDTIILNLLVALVLEAYDQVTSSASGSSRWAAF